MAVDKQKCLVKGVWSLVWMFHRRKLKNCINKIHEKALTPTYNDNNSTFRELLGKDESMTMHHRNLHSLPIGAYKVIIPQILFLRLRRKYSSQRKHTYNLRFVSNHFMQRKIETTSYALQSLKYLFSKNMRSRATKH